MIFSLNAYNNSKIRGLQKNSTSMATNSCKDDEEEIRSKYTRNRKSKRISRGDLDEISKSKNIPKIVKRLVTVHQ